MCATNRGFLVCLFHQGFVEAAQVSAGMYSKILPVYKVSSELAKIISSCWLMNEAIMFACSLTLLS